MLCEPFFKMSPTGKKTPKKTISKKRGHENPRGLESFVSKKKFKKSNDVERQNNVDVTESETNNSSKSLPLPGASKRNKNAHAASKFEPFFSLQIVNNKKIAICKLCKDKKKRDVEIKMTDGNTSGVGKHLQKQHTKEFFEIFPDKKASSNPIAEILTKQKNVQVSLSFYFEMEMSSQNF